MSDMDVDLDVAVEMRDGTILRADVYRPARGGPWPVLLHRTPYGKRSLTSAGLLDVVEAVKRGYIVVHQDTRGRFASDGFWEPWSFEQHDGFDTVRWAAGLTGSDGNVGMFGASYTGNTQWSAALAGPPELKALVPQVTWSDPRDGLFFRGGALELGLNAAWSLQQGFNHVTKTSADAADLSRRINQLIADYDGLLGTAYWELPSGDLPAIERSNVPDIGLQQALRDPAAVQACLVAGKHDQIQLPTLNIGGWYDIFLQGTLDNYMSMRKTGAPTGLIIGPWTHPAILGMSAGQVGDVNFGLKSWSQFIAGETSIMHLQLQWFDQWLKGVDTGVLDERPVRIFVMGKNEWRYEDSWPLQRAVGTELYLRVDAALSWSPPELAEERDAYVYDPANPVMTHGGPLVMSTEFPAGPYDQHDVEARPDVLVYTSEPLQRDVEITGRVVATLFAASDAPSTDWVVRLCWVDDDGVSRNLTDGIVRSEVRPPEIAEIQVDLWSTSIALRAGQRIRIQVTSSNFPRWDRNLGNGERPEQGTTMRVAHQVIYHDAARPSRVTLPIVGG